MGKTIADLIEENTRRAPFLREPMPPEPVPVRSRLPGPDPVIWLDGRRWHRSTFGGFAPRPRLPVWVGPASLLAAVLFAAGYLAGLVRLLGPW